MPLPPGERDLRFMALALDEARAALAAGELPVGCVVVLGDEVIASAGNTRFASRVKIAHAEMNALREAERLLHENHGACEVFVTLEPCMMCFGALTCSRVGRVVFGARDYLAGATGLAHLSEHYSEFSPEVVGGVLAGESLGLLKEYVARNGARAGWTLRYFGLDLSPR